jgi:DNA-binding transcriptional MerR regulator
MTAERNHSSIGEVLTLLQPEFPDVTISKIRFLESQGLLDPERTPSGYRKFRDEDIDRLRWILAQQRDHFLPLKVIKERLLSGDLDGGPPDGVLPLEPAKEEDPSAEAPESVDASDATDSAGAESDARDRARAVASLLEGPDHPEPVEEKPAKGERKRHPTGHTKGEPTPESDSDDEVDVAPRTLSLEELCAKSGLTVAEVGELQKYGLLDARSIGQVSFYDGDALMIARLAAGFGRYGIEPRHLRMYKVSAEREAGLFEQLITPLLKQRRAAARDQAVEMLEDLAELADDLRAVMVRAALREYLGDS